jgi:hypothetical protein
MHVVFISSSVRTDNIYLPMVNWLTIGTDGPLFGGLPYPFAMLTTSFPNGLSIFTDGGFISPPVSMENIYLPMVNWLTIGTDGTGGQGFRGLPYALAMLTTSFANGLSTFADGGFISPSVRMENICLPMVNWLTIGTDGQGFGGLPYALALLTTSSPNGL